MVTLVEKWRWQNGSDGQDLAFSIAAAHDGSVVLAGYTEGSSRDRQMGLMDFSAVKLGPNGTEEWWWQDGTQHDEAVFGAKVGEDGSIVLFGGTAGHWGDTHEGSADIVVAKLHSNGSLLWGWQGGTSENEQAESGALTSDGSAVYVGHTDGDWNGTNSGGTDFIVGIISNDGQELRRWQAGTAGNDTALFISVGDDDTFVISGHTDGDWDGESAGGDDFAAFKLTSDGTILWRWQDGTENNDELYHNAVGPDGSIYICGRTSGDWNASNEGYEDFAVVKLDSEGREVWRWQEGTPYSDWMWSVVVVEDGAIILAGETGGSWVEETIGGMNFASVKLDREGNVLWRWQEGTATYQFFTGITTGPGGMVYAGGFTRGGWLGATKGEADFVALAFNGSEDPIEGWPPTPSPVVDSILPTSSPIFGERPTPSPGTASPATPLPTPVPIPVPTGVGTLPPTPFGTTDKPSSPSGSADLHGVALIGGLVGGALLFIVTVVLCFPFRNRTNQEGQPPTAGSQRVVGIDDGTPSHKSSAASPADSPARGGSPSPPPFRAIVALPSYRSIVKLPSYRSIFGRNTG